MGFSCIINMYQETVADVMMPIWRQDIFNNLDVTQADLVG